MTFKYNWEKHPKAEDLLTKIYNNTLASLGEKYAEEFVIDIDDFLYYMLTFYSNSFEKIIDCLYSVELIGFQKDFYIIKDETIILNPNMTPPVVNIENKILLNPFLKGDSRLTEEERRRLYLYHGLVHNILSFKNEKTKEFSKIYSDVLGNNKYEVETIVDNGWLLLEEVIAQELAEKATYTIIGKTRPGKRYGIESRDLFPIDDNNVFSNLEFYRMFQDILINFGTTISKIGNTGEYSVPLIIIDILKKAINTNFSESVISEYINKGNETELYILLYLMGILINEKYATYGLRPIKELKINSTEVQKIYSRIYYITNGLFNLDEEEYQDEDIPHRKTNELLRRRILKVVEEHKY